MNITSKIAARFKAVVRNKDNDAIIGESAWGDNLVLDAGLKRMSVGHWVDRCCVGTGTVAPVVTDTALTSFKASSGWVIATQSLGYLTAKPYYSISRLTFRFDVGTAIGNVSEVGLGWDNTSLWNKSLLVDNLGIPTPVVVGSNDYLDILVEIRVYLQDDFTGTINLLNIDNSVASTHNYTGKILIASNPEVKLPFEKIKSQLYVLDQDIGNNYISNSSLFYNLPVESNPSTTSYKAVTNIAKNEANTNHRLFSITVNFAQSVYQNQPTRGCGFKIELTPPIIKTDTMALQHSFTLSWDRYVA